MAKLHILISKFDCTVDGIDHLYKKVMIYYPAKAKIDLKTAIQNACTEFIQTPTGNQIYQANNQTFTWTDFILHVPNNINQKHGFQVSRFTLERILDTTPYTQVDWFDNLIL